jgi:hypothetical protein
MLVFIVVLVGPLELAITAINSHLGLWFPGFQYQVRK